MKSLYFFFFLSFFSLSINSLILYLPMAVKDISDAEKKPDITKSTIRNNNEPHKLPGSSTLGPLLF